MNATLDIKSTFHGPMLHSMKINFNQERREWIEENMESKNRTWKDLEEGEFPEHLLSFDNYREKHEQEYLEKSVKKIEDELEEHKKALASKKKSSGRRQPKKEEDEINDQTDVNTEVDPDDFPKVDDEEPIKAAESKNEDKKSNKK